MLNLFVPLWPCDVDFRSEYDSVLDPINTKFRCSGNNTLTKMAQLQNEYDANLSQLLGGFESLLNKIDQLVATNRKLEEQVRQYSQNVSSSCFYNDGMRRKHWP